MQSKNFRPEQSNSLIRSSRELKITEWFEPVAENEIVYRFTVSDPQAYTRPWTGERTITRRPNGERMYEFACHEGNYAMQYMLSGAHADERNQDENSAASP